MSKFLEAWIDVETTGDDPQKHALIELSMSIYKGPELIKNLELTFKPLPGDKLKKKALDSIGYDLDKLKTLDNPRESFSKFKGTLDRYVNPYNSKDKLIFYAYNAQFDFRFLHGWVKRRMDFQFLGSYFWWPPVDVASIVMDKIPDCRVELQTFKLGDIATYLGIKVDPDKLHEASYDIELTRSVYDAVKNGTS